MIGSIQTEIVQRLTESESSAVKYSMGSSTENSCRSSGRRFRTETSSFRNFSTSSDSQEKWDRPLERGLNQAYLERRYEDAIALIDQVDRDQILQEIKDQFEEFLIGKEREEEPSKEALIQAYINQYAELYRAAIAQGFDYKKACSLALLNRPEEALELYSHLETIEDLPLSNDVLLSGGLFYLQAGEVEKAAAEFWKMEEMDTEEILILAVLGQKLGQDFLQGADNDCLVDSLIQSGKYREAIEELKRIISNLKSDEFYPGLHQETIASKLAQISFCHAMLGEWEESTAKMKEAAELDLGPDVVFAQAVLSLLEGDWSGAEEAEKHRMDIFGGPYEPHIPLLLTIKFFENFKE